MKDLFIIMAIILNASVVGVSVIFCVEEGGPDELSGLLLFSFICVLCPIVNIIVISSLRWPTKKDSWLGLYFRRKQLEEQRRIEALEKDKQGKTEYK